MTDLYRMAHSLAGSGAAYGATAVSDVAGALEQKFKSLLNEIVDGTTFPRAIKQEVDGLLVMLRRAADEWQPSNSSYVQQGGPEEQFNSSLVHLVEDDESLAADLIAEVEHAGYRVRRFVELNDFEAACEKEAPAAVIIDLVCKKGEIAGADVISSLKAGGKADTPVIFISGRDDMEARLAAARAGASRYFSKPPDMKKLIRTLDGLTVRTVIKRFRVLLIDDDEDLLDYYAVVLREAGLKVKTLSKPLEGLKVLARFRPDVVVMDVYMPECSGLELARVIRQDDAWALMPIIFISTKSELNSQLAAINPGCDDFLVKPVEPDHLAAVVVARAKLARRAGQLNRDLDDALRESKYRLSALDHHAIVSITDINGRISAVNDKLCEISGYSREEILGQNHRMFKSGQHPDTFYKDMWTTITHGKVWQGVVCNRRKNGSEYWVETTIVPFIDDKGHPYQYICVRNDITALRISEERLQRSQFFANIGTWDWNIKTGELYCSERIGPLFGYHEKAPENTYENFLSAVHPDDRQIVVDGVNNCVEHGAEYNVEHRVVWPDGSVHWVHGRGDVLRSEAGEPLHMLGVIQDITERKQAEEKNWRNYQIQTAIGDIMKAALENISLKELLQKTIDIITGTSVVSTKPACAIFLADESDKKLAMAACKDLNPALVKKCANVSYGICHCGKAAKSRYIRFADCLDHRYEITYDGIHPHGHYCVPILLQSRLLGVLNIFLEAGQHPSEEEREFLDMLVNTLAVIIDRRQSEQDLGRFKTTLDQTMDCVFMFDPYTLKYFYVNAGATAQVGYGYDELMNMTPIDIKPEFDEQSFRQVIDPMMAGGGNIINFETLHRHKDGHTIPVDIFLQYVAPEGDSPRFVAIVHDSTERKKTEAELLRSKEEAENANRAKSQFLSRMSHELRTPMNAIIGFSQLLKMEIDPPLSESQLENVDEIAKAGNYLLTLINEVLDLAGIEAGRIDLSIGAVVLGEVIADSLDLITPLSRKRGIEIRLTRDGEDITFDQLWKQQDAVRADQTRLRQVFLNLLSNAVKYNSDNGKIIISCNNTGNNQTRVSITDTGAGLTREQQGQLFRAFERLEAEHSGIEGTGIGLVITKKIVELMGGSIGVESRPGKGSTFWIELQRDILPQGLVIDDDKKISEKKQSAATTEYEHTVLYIEDNPVNLRLVNQLLGRRPNIHMWSAHEPMLGLELAAEHKPDLILLDINLPGMDGYELLKKLRQREATRDTPVIAISANAMPKDIDKGNAAGFTDYLTKPLDVPSFFSAVDRALGI